MCSSLPGKKAQLSCFPFVLCSQVYSDSHLARRIVFVEGNYVLLFDEQPWDQLQLLLDDRLFMDTDLDESMEWVFR